MTIIDEIKDSIIGAQRFGRDVSRIFISERGEKYILTEIYGVMYIIPPHKTSSEKSYNTEKLFGYDVIVLPDAIRIMTGKEFFVETK